MELINFLIERGMLQKYTSAFINGFVEAPGFYMEINPIAFQYPFNAFLWSATGFKSDSIWSELNRDFTAQFPKSYYSLVIDPHIWT